MTPEQAATAKRKIEDGKRLRERTGACLGDCFKALIECRGDEDRAVEWLRARMLMR